MRPTFCPQCNEPLSRPGGATPLVCPICSTVIAPENAALTDAPPSPATEERGNELMRPPVEPSLRVIQPLSRAWRLVYNITRHALARRVARDAARAPGA